MKTILSMICTNINETICKFLFIFVYLLNPIQIRSLNLSLYIIHLIFFLTSYLSHTINTFVWLGLCRYQINKLSIRLFMMKKIPKNCKISTKKSTGMKSRGGLMRLS